MHMIATVLSVPPLFMIDFDKDALEQEVPQAWTLCRSERGIQQPGQRITFVTSDKCEREISGVRGKMARYKSKEETIQPPRR